MSSVSACDPGALRGVQGVEASEKSGDGGARRLSFADAVDVVDVVDVVDASMPEPFHPRLEGPRAVEAHEQIETSIRTVVKL